MTVPLHLRLTRRAALRLLALTALKAALMRESALAAAPVMIGSHPIVSRDEGTFRSDGVHDRLSTSGELGIVTIETGNHGALVPMPGIRTCPEEAGFQGGRARTYPRASWNRFGRAPVTMDCQPSGPQGGGS